MITSSLPLIQQIVLSADYVSGVILGTEDTAVNPRDQSSCQPATYTVWGVCRDDGGHIKLNNNVNTVCVCLAIYMSIMEKNKVEDE